MILDIHTHTLSSGHAYSTVAEMINAAIDKGLKYLGFSDHAPNMPGSAYIYHFQNLKVIPREVKGLRILRGAEANIIDYTGKIDMNEDILKTLDYAIASLHPPCIGFGSKMENTAAMIGAIKNPYVRVIGHPDDLRFPVDYEEVVKAASAYQVLLEVNNSSLDPKGYRKHAKNQVIEYLELSQKYNHPVILASDAHICYDVGNFDYCLEVLKETGFNQQLIVNRDFNLLKNFLKSDPFKGL